MNHPDDPILIKHIKPESAGWMRVPGRPRTWEKPDGSIHVFLPDEREILIVPVENAWKRFQRLVVAEFKKWTDEQESSNL